MADEFSSTPATGTDTSTQTETPETGEQDWGGKTPEDLLKEAKERSAQRKAAREKETPEDAEKRKAEKAERRAKETPEEKKARESRKALLEKAKQHVRTKPAEGETPEQHKARLARQQESDRERETRREARRKERGELEKLRKEVSTAQQIKKEGYAKFEEAARLRKQFAEIQNVAKQNPAQALVEIAETLGLGEDALNQLFQQRSAFEKQWEAMTPDQRQLYVAQQKLHALETQRQEQATQQQQEQQQQELRGKQDAFEKELASKTLPTMKAAGVPQNPLTLKLVGATLAALADRDGIENPPDIGEAVEYVADLWRSELGNAIEAYAQDPRGFATRHPKVYAAIREHSVAEARGAAPQKNGGKPPSTQTPRETETDSKAPSWSDFSRQMRQLQMGRR